MVHFVAVLAQAEQFCFHVSRVPHADALVSRSRDHKAFVEGRVVYREDLGNVGLDALTTSRLTSIPYFEFFVVAHRGELVDIVMVPANVLDHLRVRLPHVQRVDRW